jgi:tetratricopeptide (TPR) repeat protein
MPRQGRSRIPIWKKLVFALLVTGAFFVLVEVILTLVGVRPALYDEDPFVGFASTVPLFVEETDDSGTRQMVTARNRLRLFNAQRFPKSKPGGTYRIFCLGGSTTYGRPYDDATSFAGWLREFLPRADDSRRWEVVNAGGISYASYRVAMLMDELSEYEPDLFVVYTGHNEFLERRTYQVMLDTPLAVRNLEAVANRTRTYSALRRLIRGSEKIPRWDGDRRDVLSEEVEAILDQTVGPQSYTRDDAMRQRVLAHYRHSLNRMVALAQFAGADIIFVTPASNLRDFTPLKSEHRADLSESEGEDWLRDLNRAGEAFRSKQFETALSALDEAAELDDRHAKLHFLRGRVLLHLDRVSEAREAFVRARDEDVCPLRAITPMRQIVLDVAKKHDVPAVDFVAMMDQRADDGIPGYDLFLDHVHPTIEGHRELALTLVDTMQTEYIVARSQGWNAEAVEEVTLRVYDGLDYSAHANALRNLAKVLGWAGKFDEADERARLAVKGLPNDANAHYLAANAFWRDGRLDDAIAEFEQAVQIDPQYSDALVQLGYALLENAQPDAALESFQRALRIDPDQADIYLQIGNIYYDRKDLDKAASLYREGIARAPDNAQAHKNLAWVSSRQDQLQTAVHHYERALELDPADSVAHGELASAYVKLKKYALATDHYQLAILLDPQYAAGYIGLGRVAELQEDLTTAASYYEQALQIDPDLPQARQGLKRISPEKRGE